MGLTLKELKSIMAPLSEVGKGELSFDVNGVTIVLRALSPDEELQAMRYAQSAISEGEGANQITVIDYLDRFKYMLLAYSIVQVGSTDFRSVTMVETGEKLPNGTPIKVKKHDALIGILSTWSRNMTTAMFRKFGELAFRVEGEVDKTIKFEDVDYDAEIARLEERVADLKEQKSRQDMSANDPRSQLRTKALLTTGTRLPEQGGGESNQTQGQEDTSFPVREKSPAEFVSLGSDVERGLAEEVEEGVPEVPQEPRKPLFAGAPPARPQPQVQTAPQPVQNQEPNNDPLSDVDSSFVDISSPEALEAENRRLLQMRSQGVRPPHALAREAFRDLQAKVDEGSDEKSPTAPVGKLGGMDVYKMPTQNLTERKPGPVRSPAFQPSGPNVRQGK